MISNTIITSLKEEIEILTKTNEQLVEQNNKLQDKVDRLKERLRKEPFIGGG